MPRPVALMPRPSRWPERAGALIEALRAAAPGAFVALHHIGSTAVPGLMAKPVIDLLGETGDLARIEAARSALDGLGLEGPGWRWRGENGEAGRRYFTRDDPETGARGAHLHVYAAGDPALAWHVAFRDRLRAEPATAAAYEREKSRCAALHPDDSRAYAACKKAWTDGVAAEAVRGWGGSG
ncbi:MAG: GrpB family protein [Brevundimonas sp.]|uniref:GrpB family protein n=1 Tax=Brevundimonas sp. TaxID=1871086 RepID=UPI002AB914FB|nr:GrpB family protein [Brevundimonas sp.]MDZ4111095.1 GrpB family protein [Brevundimonas sp.]